VPKATKLPETAIESILRRDRLVLGASLAVLTLLAWAYLAYLAWDMQHMDMSDPNMDMNMAMPTMRAWRTAEYLLMFVMWAVMMIAMMIPSAAPMILMFARVNRERRERQRPYVPTAVFVAGYLAVWSAFSAAATVLQGALHQAALLSPMMVSTSSALGGGLLLAAGVFQWTPLKRACLDHCRSPLSVIMSEWREGPGGAFLMGLRHGAYCTGCCWILMALLFVAGVMNLLWIAMIAVFVLVEKAAPQGQWVGRVAGLALIAAGAYMIAG
jgi:predicted metal-binding membrane protein